MLNAIHKESGKLVSAFKIETDAEWIGKERDVWIAPRSASFNWRELKKKGIIEVELSFIKSHERKNEGEFPTFVKRHFRINNEVALQHYINESEEHKLAKESIYEKIISNKLKVNGKEIKEIGEIEDVGIEERLSKSQKSKIADVCLTFKKENSLYGKGIVFEIQFSTQNEEVTGERTYDRVLEGYSVCWLWEGNFKDNKLINEDVEVIQHLKAIEEFKETTQLKWITEINNLSRTFSNKAEEIRDKLNNYEEEFDNKIDNQLNFFLLEKEKIIELVNKEAFGIKERADNIVDNSISLLKERKEKVLREILEDELVFQKLKGSINHEELSNKIKIDIFNQTKEGILKLVEKEVKENSIKLNPQKILQKAYHNAKEEYLLRIEEQYKKFDGLYHKCPKCNNKFRIESSKILGEEIVCGTCYIKSLQIKGEEKDEGR